jgi:hypothetical protein
MPAPAKSEAVNNIIYDPLLTVVSIVNPAHHKKGVISREGASLDGRERRCLVELEGSRFTDVEDAIDDVIGRLVFIRRRHRKSEFIAVQHEMGRYDGRSHPSNILDVASPEKSTPSE